MVATYSFQQPISGEGGEYKLRQGPLLLQDKSLSQTALDLPESLHVPWGLCRQRGTERRNPCCLMCCSIPRAWHIVDAQ